MILFNNLKNDEFGLLLINLSLIHESKNLDVEHTDNNYIECTLYKVIIILNQGAYLFISYFPNRYFWVNCKYVCCFIRAMH